MALPDYLKDTAKDYARNLTATTSAPIDTKNLQVELLLREKILYQQVQLILQLQVLVVINHI